MATIAENIQTLKSIKSDIKNAIIQKGGSVTDAFGTYAQAITNLPSGGGGGTEIEDGLITRTLSGAYSNDRVSRVGQGAFMYCSSLTSVNLPNCKYLDYGVFGYCSKLTTVNLPNCLSGGYAVFSGCSKLTTVNLPICSTIGQYAFANCVALSSIYLPLCYRIMEYTFESCIALTTIKLPLCTYISNYVFQGCSNLKEVYLNSVSKVTTIQSNTFSNCPNLTSVYVPSSLVDAFKTAQYWSSISNKIVAYTEA